MFRGKRGTTGKVFNVLTDLVLIAIIVMAMFSFVKTIKDKSAFEKVTLARDLAYIGTATQHTPGDVLLTYTHSKFNLAKYTYDFTKGKLIQIYKDPQDFIVGYPFLHNTFFELVLLSIEKPRQLMFYEKDDKFTVNEYIYITETKKELLCSEEPSTKLKKEILAIPSEDELSKSLFEYHKIKKSYKVITKSPTQTTDVVISISLAEDQTQKKITSAFIRQGDVQSEKMACLILKQLQELDIEATKPLMLDQKTNFPNKDGIAITLELINIEDDEITSIVESISAGMEEYYG